MTESRRIGRLAAAMSMLALVAAAGGAQAAPPSPAKTATTLTGVWEAARVNKQPLPMTDQVVGEDGFNHAIRLHEMTIRLRPNGRFQAALRYRQAILSKGEKVDKVPLQTDTWVGTYTITGTHMRFVPEKQGKRQVQPFEGEVAAGNKISVGFDYEIVTRKHYILDLNLNPNIF